MKVVLDLSSITFIAALHRFVARRELLQTLYSDNATNFVSSSNVLSFSDVGDFAATKKFE